MASMRRSSLRACVLALLMALATAACSPGDDPAPEDPQADVPRKVGVQLFQWNWDSVARECTEQLGPHDYAFVLLSPAQEHIQGEQWWTSYQPVSHLIESKLGTREQFEAMVAACHDAGVQVIADAVINHMAGVDGGHGVAGSEFSHHHYPDLFTQDDFHLDCGTPSGNIENYRDRREVQECRLSNLSDLRTGDEHVRDVLVAYLEDLRSLGVDGFRIDAAKHMPAEDVVALTSRLEGDPLIISEVIRASSEPIQPEEYLEAGSVFAFQFARDLAGLMPTGAVRRSITLKDGQVPSGEAYTFVTNHDTERNGQTLSYADGDAYRLGSILMLATDYGTPTLYSGYAFSDRDAGAPQRDGVVDDVTCARPSESYGDGDWVCDHHQLHGMVTWAAVVGDEPVTNDWNTPRAVAFDRGDKGLVAINADDEELVVTLTTRLPDGTYCDVAAAPFQANEGCTTSQLEVADGEVEVRVSPTDAVAIHVGAVTSG